MNNEPHLVAERLNQWMEMCRIQTLTIAFKTGLEPEQVRAMQEGMQYPVQYLYKLANTYPKLNLNWLMTGKGIMEYRPEKVAPAVPYDYADVKRRYFNDGF